MKGLDNNKCLLIYGFNQEEKEVLERVKDQENLGKIIEITDTMTSMTLRNLIEGPHFEVVSKTLPKEKVILFNNLSDNELENSIRALRGSLEAKPIFAVVTPTSIEWTFADLLEHLIEEREFFRKRQK